MRHSVNKAKYRQEVYEGYRQMVMDMAFKQGFEVVEQDDEVLKDGTVIGKGKQRWFKAWHFLEYGNEGFVLY
jgi:hypothetical protein